MIMRKTIILVDATSKPLEKLFRSAVERPGAVGKGHGVDARDAARIVVEHRVSAGGDIASNHCDHLRSAIAFGFGTHDQKGAVIHPIEHDCAAELAGESAGKTMSAPQRPVNPERF